jgi:hypothetical protein
MLDAYVIEEIKRRERENGRDDRPVIELPLPVTPNRSPDRSQDDHDDGDHGVMIIDYSS